MNIKEPTGRLARWALLLQQHYFIIQHCSGPTNGNADTLSRCPYGSVVVALDKLGLQIKHVKELQRTDPSLVHILNYFETERLPNNSSGARGCTLLMITIWIHMVFCATLGAKRVTCSRY